MPTAGRPADAIVYDPADDYNASPFIGILPQISERVRIEGSTFPPVDFANLYASSIATQIDDIASTSDSYDALMTRGIPLSGDFRGAVLGFTSDDSFFPEADKDLPTWAASLMRIERYARALAGICAFLESVLVHSNDGSFPGDNASLDTWFDTQMVDASDASTPKTNREYYPELSLCLGAPFYDHKSVLSHLPAILKAMRTLHETVWRSAHVLWRQRIKDCKDELVQEGFVAKLYYTTGRFRCMVGQLDNANDAERLTHSWLGGHGVYTQLPRPLNSLSDLDMGFLTATVVRPLPPGFEPPAAPPPLGAGGSYELVPPGGVLPSGGGDGHGGAPAPSDGAMAPAHGPPAVDLAPTAATVDAQRPRPSGDVDAVGGTNLHAAAAPAAALPAAAPPLRPSMVAAPAPAALPTPAPAPAVGLAPATVGMVAAPLPMAAAVPAAAVAPAPTPAMAAPLPAAVWPAPSVADPAGRTPWMNFYNSLPLPPMLHGAAPAAGDAALAPGPALAPLAAPPTYAVPTPPAWFPPAPLGAAASPLVHRRPLPPFPAAPAAVGGHLGGAPANVAPPPPTAAQPLGGVMPPPPYPPPGHVPGPTVGTALQPPMPAWSPPAAHTAPGHAPTHFAPAQAVAAAPPVAAAMPPPAHPPPGHVSDHAANAAVPLPQHTVPMHTRQPPAAGLPTAPAAAATAPAPAVTAQTAHDAGAANAVLLQQLQAQVQTLLQAQGQSTALPSSSYSDQPLSTSPTYAHLFNTIPPQGGLIYIYAARSKPASPHPSAVPTWDYTSGAYRDFISKPLQGLRLPDIPSSSSSSVITLYASWLKAVYSKMQALDLAPYVFTSGYALPNEPEQTHPGSTERRRTYCLFQQLMVQKIRSSLTSPRSQDILHATDTVAMPPGRDFLTHEHNVAFRLIIAIKVHLFAQTTEDAIKQLRLELKATIKLNWRYWDRYVRPIRVLCDALAEVGFDVNLSDTFTLMAQEMWVESRIDPAATPTFEHEARKKVQAATLLFVHQYGNDLTKCTWERLWTEVSKILGTFALMSDPGLSQEDTVEIIPGMHEPLDVNPIAAMPARATTSTPWHGMSADRPGAFCDLGARCSNSDCLAAHPAYAARFARDGAAPRQFHTPTSRPHADVMRPPTRDQRSQRSSSRGRERSRSREASASRGQSRSLSPYPGRQRGRSNSRERRGFSDRRDGGGHHGPPRETPLRPPPGDDGRQGDAAGPPSHRPQGEAPSVRQYNRTDRRCFVCQQPGHMAHECHLVKTARAALDEQARDGKRAANAASPALTALKALAASVRESAGAEPGVDSAVLQAQLHECEPDIDHAAVAQFFQ